MAGSVLRPILIGGVGALLTAGFSLAGNYIYHYFTADSLGLSYFVTEGPSLPKADGFTEIYAVNARNSGRKEVSDLVVRVSVKQGKIEQGSWSASEGVTAKDTIGNNTYQVLVPLLNPNERVSVATIMTTPETIASPDVVVRAVGIRGVKEDAPSPGYKGSNDWAPLAVVMLVALVSLTLFAEIARGDRKVANLFLRGIGLDRATQREALTYILYACGIDEEAEKTRLTAAHVTYAESADHLLQRALRLPENERDHEIVALKCMLLIRAMLPSSKENVRRALRILKGASEAEMADIDTRSVENWRDEIDRLTGEAFAKRSVNERPIAAIAS